MSGLTQFRDRFEIVNQSLQAERQSVSGVDETEEIVRLLQYQRGFQSAARYVSALDETLREQARYRLNKIQPNADNAE